MFSTDSLPVAGGSLGAVLTQTGKFFPDLQTIIATVIIAALGAVVGYFVKLILDSYFKCKPRE